MTDRTEFLLDTNACILYLNKKSPSIEGQINNNFDKICLCDIVVMELFYGAYKSQSMTKNLTNVRQFIQLFPVLEFNIQIAEMAGEIRADLAKKGTPIGAYDLLIASTALFFDKTVITHNVGEFSRVKNLKWQDWQI